MKCCVRLKFWRISVPTSVEMVHWTSELNVKLNTVCVETNINTVNKTPLKNTVTSKCRIPWLPWPLPGVPLPGLPFLQNQSKPGRWRPTDHGQCLGRDQWWILAELQAQFDGSQFARLTAARRSTAQRQVSLRYVVVRRLGSRPCSVAVGATAQSSSTAPRPARLRR